MNLRKWFSARGLKFVIQRASLLLDRYGITPSKAMTRIEDTIKTLASFGSAPTFFTPGIVVERYTRFIHALQEKGAEIAVHSYQHLDLNSLTSTQARQQLDKATDTFHLNGIEVHGFRCPYLSYSDELLQTLPEGLFGYSSNRAIWMDVSCLDQNNGHNVIYNALRRFYNPQPFAETISMPKSQSNMIEIPVCVPDDLQLHDGLGLDWQGISQSWIEMLQQTHQRGELFNLIFHPELGSVCNRSFEELLGQSLKLKPAVWVTRMCDISDWWREKSGFGVSVTNSSNLQKIDFECSSRATILVRGINNNNKMEPWDGKYTWLKSQNLEISNTPPPFLGIAANVPEHVVSFLHEQGYILDTSDKAVECSVYLDETILATLPNMVQLINYIESFPSPLVRYWRWPNGAKSGLSITGDLDALTLLDYVSRLYAS